MWWGLSKRDLNSRHSLRAAATETVGGEGEEGLVVAARLQEGRQAGRKKDRQTEASTGKDATTVIFMLWTGHIRRLVRVLLH